MRKRALAIAAAVLLSACQGEDTGPARAGTVIVGHLAELTGYGADGFGRPVDWASQVALDEIKASGVLGGTELLVRTLDDATDPATAITQFNKFTAQGISIVYEPAVGRVCSAVAPLARQRRVLLMCAGSSGTGGGDTQPEFAYLNDSTGPMRLLAERVIGRNGIKTIATMFDADNASVFEAQSASFLAGMKAAGIDGYVTTQKISSKDTDFSSVLTNLRRTSPDAVMFYATPAQSGNIMRQMVQAGGFERVLKLGHIGFNEQVPQIAGSAAAAVLFPQAWVPDAASATFIDAYTKVSGGKLPSVYAALGHDTVWLIAVAVKLIGAEGGTPDGPAVRAKLAAAAAAPDYTAHALVKGLTFSTLGRPRVPGIIATYDASGRAVPVE